MSAVSSPNPRVSTDIGPNESSASAMSWSAIIGGAIAASALSLLLLALGTGLGFTSASAYSGAGASAATIGIGAAIWLLITQALSTGLGGYLAGRLRTKWTNTHSDEVYFRDTAHGFLVWALGAIISAILLASAASSLIGGGASLLSSLGGGITAAAGKVTGGAGQAVANSIGDPSAFVSDNLLRGNTPAPNADPQAVTAEVGRIVANSVKNGELAPADRTYVAQVVSSRTGISQADAEKKVDDTIAKAKDTAAKAEAAARDAADKARAASAYAALWLVVSMLVGAFCASYGALIGGRARDHLHGGRV